MADDYNDNSSNDAFGGYRGSSGCEGRAHDLQPYGFTKLTSSCNLPMPMQDMDFVT